MTADDPGVRNHVHLNGDKVSGAIACAECARLHPGRCPEGWRLFTASLRPPTKGLARLIRAGAKFA